MGGALSAEEAPQPKKLMKFGISTPRPGPAQWRESSLRSENRMSENRISESLRVSERANVPTPREQSPFASPQLAPSQSECDDGFYRFAMQFSAGSSAAARTSQSSPNFNRQRTSEFRAGDAPETGDTSPVTSTPDSPVTKDVRMSAAPFALGEGSPTRKKCGMYSTRYKGRGLMTGRAAP